MEAEEDALTQASIGLAAQSELELLGDFPERALPLALEAIENYPYTWQAEHALGQAVVRSQLKHIFYANGYVLDALWSPSGDRIFVSIQSPGINYIFDAASGDLLQWGSRTWTGVSSTTRGWRA